MSIFVDDGDITTDTKKMMDYMKLSSVKYFNRGVYGIGYSVRINDTSDSKYNILSLNNTEDTIKCNHLFVKLVPIFDDIKNNDTYNDEVHNNIRDILEMGATSSKDFSNEVRIQSDVYKKTNTNLEAVCPPIVYSNVLNNSDKRSRAKNMLTTMMLQMPNDENKLFLERMKKLYMIHSDMKLGVIAMSFAEKYRTLGDALKGTDIISQKIFYRYLAIYELLRLYDVGYMHGDYHSENILINTEYKYSSLEDNYSGRCLIIDYGMAFKNKHVNDYSSPYAKLHVISQEKQPQTGENAYTWNSYSWLVRFLESEGRLNDNYNHLHERIVDFQGKMTEKINVKYPGLMERIRVINESTYRGSVLKGGKMLLDREPVTELGEMVEMNEPSKKEILMDSQMTKQSIVVKPSDQDNTEFALNMNVKEYDLTDEEFEQIFNPSGMNMDDVVNEYENTIQEGIMILNGEDLNGGKKKGYKKNKRNVQTKKRGKQNKKKTRNRAKVRVKCGGQKKTKKRVVFAECMSDSDCTLDKPECDEKNNICVQKMRFYGGKTKKRALKKMH